MNDTLIDLYRGVQGRRGEWQVGDRVYLTRMNEYGTVHTLRSDGDIDVRFDGGWTLDCCHDDPDLLWLPPVWSDDGRCLTGLIEGDKRMVYADGKWTVGRYFGGFWVWTEACDTLPEALLRAIREQEGKG